MILDLPSLVMLQKLLDAYIERSTGERSARIMANSAISSHSILDAINGGLDRSRSSRPRRSLERWMSSSSGITAEAARGKLLGEIFPQDGAAPPVAAITTALPSAPPTINHPRPEPGPPAAADPLAAAAAARHHRLTHRRQRRLTDACSPSPMSRQQPDGCGICAISKTPVMTPWSPAPLTSSLPSMRRD